ncbi:MAG: hypothetical protein QOE31_14, partial [Solirubrobacteraceae bacterium]|nr:hypothetical protein [Solirubrobacteraceae bacterium]
FQRRLLAAVGAGLAIAVVLSKLIIPVLLRDVDERATPPVLADREWVFLRERDGFDGGLVRLVEALETDLQWRDEHTRIAGRTREWVDADRNRSFLLRGAELREAELWLAGQASHRQRATSEQAEYILASRRAAVAFQRRLLAAVGAGLAIAVVLAGVALHQKNVADAQRTAALSRGLTAQSQTVLEDDPGLAGVLRIEANRLKQTAATRDDLLSLLPRLTNLSGRLSGMLTAGHAVAFSRDGRRLAGASDDATLPIWDVADHSRVAALRGPPGGAQDVAFSPDGDTLAYAGSDGKLYLWDAVRRVPRGAGLPAHSGPVSAVAFSPDGRILASAGSDGAVRLWDPERRAPIRDLARAGAAAFGDAATVDALAFSVDGRTLATAGSDGDVRLWDVAGGRPAGVIAGHGTALYAVAFSPDGRHLAFGGEDSTVWLASLADRSRPATGLRGHDEPVRGLAFDRRTGMLASASIDGSVRLWDPAHPRAAGSRLVGHRKAVLDVAFSFDGSRLASSDAAGAVLLWDMSPHPRLSFDLGRLDGPVADVAFGRGATLVTAESDDATLRVWDVAARRQARTLDGHAKRIEALAVTADGGTLAAAGSGGSLELWDLAAHEPAVRRLTRPPGHVRDMSFDGGMQLAVVTGGPRGALTLWDLRAGHPAARTLERRDGGYRSVAFSADGRRIAYGDDDGAVRIRPATAAPASARRLAAGHSLAVYALAFSPDGAKLASASLDQEVRIWDVARRVGLGSLAEGAAATAVVFSPDGRTLASGDQDDRVRLWDVATRRPLGSPLARHSDYVNELSFSRDGSMLASGGEDGRVIVWRSPLWERDARALGREICARIRRDLSRQDWRVLLPGEDYRRTCPAA